MMINSQNKKMINRTWGGETWNALLYLWVNVLVVEYHIHVCTWEKVCVLRKCWALARIHTLGWRATNPCLQWHLNEPLVLIQRAFLQGLDLVPRPAHSSISRGRERWSLKWCLSTYLQVIKCVDYRSMTLVSEKISKSVCAWLSALTLTCTACSWVVQYKSSIALAHRTQIGPYTPSISTATLIWVFFWTVSLWTHERDRTDHETLQCFWVFLLSSRWITLLRSPGL